VKSAEKLAKIKAAEQAASDKAAAEKASAEKAAAEKVAADKAAAEKAAAERAQLEKAIADKAATEKARLLAASSLDQFKVRHPGKEIYDQEPGVSPGIFHGREIIYVDDKNCPQGQIKEVTTGDVSRGIDRKYRCINLSQ
jgi:hypothetical protein